MTNDLHTTINGLKEEGGYRDYREWKGDPPAKRHEISWNGYPLPVGLRITDIVVKSSLPPGPPVRTEKQKAQRREQNKRRRERCAQLHLL